jgi:hypothetical protein
MLAGAGACSITSFSPASRLTPALVVEKLKNVKKQAVKPPQLQGTGAIVGLEHARAQQQNWRGVVTI